jgi:hypothetical protein
VDNRCKNCEYLGYPWLNAQRQRTDHADHCMPTALRQDHVSRVAFVSRGARIPLDLQGVRRVSSLAQRLPADSVFDAHQVLRASRLALLARLPTAWRFSRRRSQGNEKQVAPLQGPDLLRTGLVLGGDWLTDRDTATTGSAARCGCQGQAVRSPGADEHWG